MERSKKIIRTSIVGIIVNLILVLFKMLVGMVTGSIAIILDAVNNMGDALSSIITIVGTKLAGKAPDNKHPYGYGRIEYLTSVIIAAIVLMAGATSLRESIDKVLHPQSANYTVVSLVIIAVGVVAKFLCGRYVKGIGEKLDAQSLIASGSDAFFDSILSSATFAAAVVSMIWGISLEGILGLVISLIIIKAGIEMMMETIHCIIGERVDQELTNAVKAKTRTIKGVRGAYDLTLHNYGPTETIGSIHVEVDDNMTAHEIHHLTHQITKAIYDEFRIILTVGIYASNTSDPKVVAFREKAAQIATGHEGVLQTHGFYMDEEIKTVMFDVVMDFKIDEKTILGQIYKELEQEFPGYHFEISKDTFYSDI